jgi:hypothetical protein
MPFLKEGEINKKTTRFELVFTGEYIFVNRQQKFMGKGHHTHFYPYLQPWGLHILNKIVLSLLSYAKKT